MAEYEDGASGQVSNEAYCMKKSMQAKNVEMTNKDMGYHDMADQANSKAFPVAMVGEKKNSQLSPKAADNNYDYNKHR